MMQLNIGKRIKALRKNKGIRYWIYKVILPIFKENYSQSW